MEPDSGGGKDAAEPTTPKRESLWLLDRADGLMRDIAAACWLSIASVWRVARALVSRDSVARIDVLLVRRQILPPTVALFVAAVVSALMLASLLSARFPDQGPSRVMGKLSSASAESWLLVAAPALVSLWVAAFLIGRALGASAGRHALDPTAGLTHAVSASTMLTCTGLAVAEAVEWFYLPERPKLNLDAVVLVGLLLLLAALAVAGWRYGQQTFAAAPAPRWRRRLVVYLLAPVCFVSVGPVALVIHYWLFRLQAAVVSTSPADPNRKPSPFANAYAPACFVVPGSLICQLLVSSWSDSDLAVGPLNKVSIRLRDSKQRGARPFNVELLADGGQIEQRSPRVDAGNFWKLRSRDPTPVAFQIPRNEACRLLELVAKVPPQALEMTFTAHWYPGFGLIESKKAGVQLQATSDEFLDPEFGQRLSGLCGKERMGAATPSELEGSSSKRPVEGAIGDLKPTR